MSLNELNDDLKAKLPSTDSRLRPDVRKLEEGDIGKTMFCFPFRYSVQLVCEQQIFLGFPRCSARI